MSQRPALACLLAFLFSTTVLAQDSLSPEEPADAPPNAQELGFTIAIGAGSAYNARGLNMYQSETQRDSHAYLMPSLTWTPPGSSFSLGWFSAFQLNGALAGTHIAQGISAEQDFLASYTFDLPREGFSSTATLALIAYPFATQEQAGAEVPLCAEPSVSVDYAGLVDASLALLYSHGVQHEFAESRHLYLNPSVGKEFALGPRLSLAGLASFGFKLFGGGTADGLEDNALDAALSVASPWELSPGLELRPSANLAWTNLSEVTLREEAFAWLQVDLSYSF